MRATSGEEAASEDVSESQVRLMRHRSLASTQIYARAQIDELVAKMREHYTRPDPGPPRPDPAYDQDVLAVLFPELV